MAFYWRSKLEDPEGHRLRQEQQRVAYRDRPEVKLQQRLEEERRIKEKTEIKAKEIGRLYNVCRPTVCMLKCFILALFHILTYVHVSSKSNDLGVYNL